MSLFSTIAHDGATPARGYSPKAIGMMAAGLTLAVALGFIVANNRTTTESPAAAVAPATGLTQDAFIQLNTTDLDNLAPAASTAVVESQAVNDSFIQLNTADLDNLAPAASVVAVDPFIHINVNSYDGLVPAIVTESQAVIDSNFLYWNTETLENLVPAVSADAQTSSNTSEEFLNLNIASLEYPAVRYTERPNAPR